MALYETLPGHGAGPKLARPVELFCIALVIAYAVYLAACFVDGIWLIRPDGGGVESDFITTWGAGRLALAGQVAAAYDWQILKLIEENGVRHPFNGYFGWPYPPTFLFVAMLLALLPYVTAYVTWIAVTFPLYLLAVRTIIGDRIGYLLAAAFPAVLSNLVIGQNGFLTAGLFGGTLALLERQPTLAGALLGLLTVKPHLGLLFPVALAANGRWRAFVSAGIVALLMAAASWLAFGSASWQAFFGGLGHASQAFLSNGTMDWSKLQTAFGLIRILGGSETTAWTVQIALSFVTALVTAALWRSRVSFEIKAAALGVGTVLATPYIFIYDLTILAMPLAFLFRLGRERGFLPYESAGVGAACLLILIFPFVKVPVGFAAALIIAALIARRALAQLNLQS
jgi:arabinofuranan 3-O-arabinosyltransferase